MKQEVKGVLIAVVVLYPMVGYTASFGCQKVVQEDEKTICTNRTLNDMDVEMATKYQFLQGLFPMGTRGAMQDEQKKWLRSRQQCGGDTACLTKSYKSRLRQLDKIYAGISKPL